MRALLGGQPDGAGGTRSKASSSKSEVARLRELLKSSQGKLLLLLDVGSISAVCIVLLCGLLLACIVLPTRCGFDGNSHIY